MPEADPNAGQTLELATSAATPAARGDRDDQLPGLEAERTITDWGRSERIEGLVDQVFYDFLYRYWFRVEVEGIENVPPEGGALLVANHAGAVPPDGAMVAKAIKEEHPRRQLHVVSSRSLAGVPGVGMLQTKLGRVAAHPANVERLLGDERQLVLAFPEGRPAAGKPLKERYRLRPFAEKAALEVALRRGAPIVPVAIIGAEEALPVLMRLPVPRRIPFVAPVPLPAKFRLRFLEVVPTDQLGEQERIDRRVLQTLADDLRALIQENVLELVAERRSVWLG